MRDEYGPVSRRRLLAGAGAIGLLWTPVGAVGVDHADPGCPVPPGFPGTVPLLRRVYENWSGETRVDPVWTCVPATPADVVTVANWARAHGYTLRAQGYRHGWSPLTVTPATSCASRVVLVDTTRHLTAMSMAPGDAPAVRVQSGAALEALLEYLGTAGYGVTATPAPGDLSVGGALAIGAHGTAVPAAGERRLRGATYGSLSNLVVSCTAVVWDAERDGYTLRTFHRSEPEAAAFLVQLGRAFLTEVTLRVAPDRPLRCLSRVDIPAAELFAPPGAPGRTVERFLDDSGRVEVIWFAFTDKPWLKIWSVNPVRPATSRPVTGPYNYPFSDNVPEPVAELAGRIVAGEHYLAPLLGQAQYAATAAGLTATVSADIWGASRNVLLYIRPTTLRVHANGYAVLCRRADVQRVVHGFTRFYGELLAGYAARGRYPVNGSVEIRVTGLDEPGDVAVAGAAPAALSAVRPRDDRPEWDVAVWLDVLTLPGTPDAAAFYAELEAFIFGTYDGSWAAARVEWSKGWAYGPAGAWSDPTVLDETVRASFPSGGAGSFSAAAATLARFDPHRVFTNPFLDRLLD
ncbi:FAD binding domain-containing protein [Micromonospora pattaloongensis]|uniref:FAD binding domain-containing protein n=1 Tax=Micromonospora pattaloongensis TaxID=405436 RepID=A0A1H3T718_9ACTN|nr:cholesterol oxidase substrate-binding domain-containing protein [Micromonospora pattaloongensis]SDZ45717.1 FAD binding domain-containing protein [Micromonospora pattaloongensis]